MPASLARPFIVKRDFEEFGVFELVDFLREKWGVDLYYFGLFAFANTLRVGTVFINLFSPSSCGPSLFSVFFRNVTCPFLRSRFRSLSPTLLASLLCFCLLNFDSTFFNRQAQNGGFFFREIWFGVDNSIRILFSFFLASYFFALRSSIAPSLMTRIRDIENKSSLAILLRISKCFYF